MLLATVNSGTLIIALPNLERSLHTSLLELVWVILIGFTALELVGYYGETQHWYSSGAAAAIILILSAVKFFSVVAYYMHLKFDHRLFTWLFVIGILMATFVILAIVAAYET